MGDVVLAYSGGLDTSTAIKWIEEKYGLGVIAVTIDVGQGEDLEKIKDKAIKIGAKKVYVFDKKEEFVNEFVIPALRANALYEGVYPLISSLSRPLIARTIVEVARKEGAVAVAHGCTGKGNDQVRFDVSFNILAPDLKVIAPIREWGFSRDELIDYAKKKGVPVPVTKKSPYSIDFNVWGRSIEAGVLEDPYVEPPEDAFVMTVSPEKAPDKPTYVEVDFEKGIPVAVDGKKMSPLEVIQLLNRIGGENGFGRIDHIESRLVGIKSREVYEAPGALSLIEAHRALEYLTLPKELIFIKQNLSNYYARLVYFGQWFSPMREAIDAFMEKTQEHVTGTVRLKYYRGSMKVVGRKSPESLYREELATYSEGDKFDHRASEGFIKIYGLDLVLYEN